MDILRLEKRNIYDIMLWEYAKSLIRTRIGELSTLNGDYYSKDNLAVSPKYCYARKSQISSKFRRPIKSTFGIFRHPGHKGPFPD